MGSQVLSLLLLFLYPLCSAQNTYYVTPAAGTPCPGEPCFTLSEFLTEQAPLILRNSALTLVFLPGNHPLDVNIPIVELTRLSIIGNSSSLPEVTSIIICTRPISFTFSQIVEFSISNIGLISCGDLANAPIRLERVLQAEISNCLFQGGQNGALSVVDSTVFLLENRFENNSAIFGGGLYIDRSVVNLTRNVFTENDAAVNGSGVYIESGYHSTVSFAENSFIGNSGDGAVVFVGYTNEVTFIENEFLNNSGHDIVYGSSVQIFNTFYVTPTPNTPCPGQPCHTLAEYVQQPIEYLTSNAMLAFLPGNYTLEVSIFLGGLNSLTLSGDFSSLPHVTSRIICSQPASVIFSDINELRITAMALISCGNLVDASVRIYQVYQAEISSCIFKGARSGALAVVESSVVLFNNNFESNSATTGGGVYVDESTVNFTRNDFTDNTASMNGAAVFVASRQSSSVGFIQNIFINNRGGGATVYVDQSSEITTFAGNIFTNNTADIYAIYGSAIEEASINYVTPALDIPCPLQPCRTLSDYIAEGHQYFTSNTTLVFIPGNHTLEKGLLIRDIASLAMLGHSSALVSSSVVCASNNPESLTFYNIDEVHIHSLAFISCGSSTVGAAVSLNAVYYTRISNCTFHNNVNRNDYSGIGGALAVVNSNLTLSQAIFTNNSATKTHGGGLYMDKSNVHVIGSTFSNNSASGWGGGAYAEDSMVTFVSNLFKDNIASYGGGVEVFNSEVNFTENTIIDNVAGIAGGGLEIYGTTGNITRIIIRNNTAQTAGGGVSVYPSSEVSFSEGSFMFNTAVERGGCFYVVGLTNVLNVSESTLMNNSAGGRGGGGYFGDGTANFHMNNIINNFASYNGGGLFVAPRRAATLYFTNNTIESNQGGGWVIFGDSSRATLSFTGNVFANNSGNAVYGASNASTRVSYVTPSPNVQCPAEPCLTFSEYINQISFYLSPNTIFMFLPGNHSVSSGLLVDGISSLTLFGDSASVESPPLIVCSEPVSFAVKNVADLSINSLGFASCGDSIHATVSIQSVHRAEISNCRFINSIGSGGALAVVNSALTLSKSMFENNSAIYGGGVYMSESTVEFKDNIMINNSAKIAGGGVMLLNCSVNLTGDTSFSSNSAVYTGGRIEEIVDNDNEFKNTFENTGRPAGGAMFMYGSTLTSSGSITIHKNSAEFGGGLVALESSLSLNDVTYIQNNNAKYGGGFYIIQSDIYFNGSTNLQNNFAVKSGGGIYALSASRLYFIEINNFTENSASNGGGLQLTENSLCYFSSKAVLYFIGNNAAENGGAINNEDSETSVYCPETSPSTTARSNCFFQVWTAVFLYSLSQITARINFYNNTANEGGSDVYGGTVDICNFKNITVCEDFCSIKSSGAVFDTMTGGKLKISSTPLQVCSCDQQTVNCSHSPTVRVYPGRQFSVYTTVFGQRNGTVPSIVETELSNSNIRIRDLQDIQKTSNTLMCTDLNFTVFRSLYRKLSDSTSLNQMQQQTSNLTLYTSKGPCSLEGNSLVVQIEVLGCPHGFQIHDNDNACDCDERLTGFTDECDIEAGTILKKSGSEFWIGYNSDPPGLILHPHCPFDYCKTDELYIDVDDSEVQCSYNRSGVLCGECGRNLSLVFGSSRCLQCSNNFLALLIPFAIAGILLVLLLFILRLTVASGTLHGLIFYANIVQVNSAIFFPPGHANPLTVFIAWLNLDLGIETCFYRGMDAYSKTWLQFVFPIYVWCLVVLIISVSHYSTGKVARLFGRNPIAVLATLFLLSYAKLLRTIIAALSVTYPEYPNNSHFPVWLYDGNIKYLAGRHVPLFIVAVVFLLFLFLPYTLILLLSQWLQFMPKISSFISNYRIKPFLDAYHAPYNDKHRYWIGLLLCIRCVLFLTVIYNALGDPSVNLLSISSAVVGLLTLTSLFTGTVYKNWYVGALEMSFLLNLGILTVSTYHVRATGGNQAAVTFTLLSIAFATFAGIIVYHTAMQVRGTKFWKKIRKDLHKPDDKQVRGTKLWKKNRKDSRKPRAVKYYSRSYSSGKDEEEFESMTSPVVTTSPTYSTLELSIRDSVTQLM